MEKNMVFICKYNHIFFSIFLELNNLVNSHLYYEKLCLVPETKLTTTENHTKPNYSSTICIIILLYKL